MKQVYRVLAFLIAAGVILQAAAIAYAVFAMFEWVGTGGTIDKALIESENPQIGGITGFKLHQLVGVTVLPLVALLLLISSFFARIPGGIRWGLIVFVTTLAQSTAHWRATTPVSPWARAWLSLERCTSF